MANSRHFDTVAFDVRDNASMLFFADTDASGDIKSYLLLMRASGDSLEETIYLEVDEEQLAGKDVIQQATLTGNVLCLQLGGAAAKRFGTDELVLTFDDNENNRSGIEAGALRVLGDILTGGHS